MLEGSARTRSEPAFLHGSRSACLGLAFFAPPVREAGGSMQDGDGRIFAARRDVGHRTRRRFLILPMFFASHAGYGILCHCVRQAQRPCNAETDLFFCPGMGVAYRRKTSCIGRRDSGGPSCPAPSVPGHGNGMFLVSRRIGRFSAAAFKLENPSAAEAGDGIEPSGERPYLPSFLRRVRTVSDSSAPLPTQAWSLSLSMLRVPGLVLGL